MSEGQRGTLTAKINAHLALSEGRKEEAIAQFREFMRLIEGGEQNMEDPLSNATVSKEFVLGLNAVRIADLWTSLGKEQEAAAARAEAKGWYQKALEKTKEGAELRKAVEKEMKKLP
jgi:hypothetical protein